ncbi:hypothetical protein M9H77_28411 [Catharanthus roseus]|uniref:Uncharacterized protein n=1 Tax=Catharanthus roseus TaxID=4058 RepID=A0ACC0AJJ8_CATRO|nr:hypothetical protein M9H77_28411 [Catharanthus roseus]
MFGVSRAMEANNFDMEINFNMLPLSITYHKSSQPEAILKTSPLALGIMLTDPMDDGRTLMTKCPSQSNEETHCKTIQSNPKILLIIKPLLKHYGCLSGFDLPARAHIPTDFMDELVEEMPDMASLTMSSSRSWNIKVVKGKDRITLEDGWEKFRDDNNLSPGEVLLFRYSGNWKFEVEIFSPNGCSRKLEDTEEEDIEGYSFTYEI